MGQGEDDMVVITPQEPRLLEREPALGLEVRTLRTGPMPTGVVPDARHMAVRTPLDMAAQRRRATLHDGPRGAPDVSGQGMRLFVGGKRVLENRLERDEGHRCLRTREGTILRWCILSYHANYPRAARLVQPLIHEPFCPDKPILAGFLGSCALYPLSALAG